MRYRWDAAKSRRNVRERGLPFEMARRMFEGPTVELIDDRFDYGEERVIAVGEVEAKVLVCVYADTGDVRRIISLREATRRERDGYYRAVYGNRGP
jgi:uncharacterized protein